jgi:hypothetical protein
MVGEQEEKRIDNAAADSVCSLSHRERGGVRG